MPVNQALGIFMTHRFLAVAIATLFFCLSGCSSIKTTTTVTTSTGLIASAVAGSVQPTVVLQSGLGDGKDSWKTIYQQIAVSNRVFAYDRPGYGDSPWVKAPRDPCSVATELRGALRAAGLSPPYVLVGHSLGGLYQFVFAKLYPGEVAGLLLLDPTHPSHWERMQHEAPAAAALIKGLRITSFGVASRDEFDDQTLCLDRIDTTTPLAMPVRLLTKTRFQAIELGSFETMVHSLEDDWRHLLGVQDILRVADSGHYIHHDQPAIVLEVLRSLVNEAPLRGGASPGDRVHEKQGHVR